MIELRNDYSQGAHERILDKLAGINRQPNQGYGADDYCRAAQERVRHLTGQPQAKLWFIPGGTQANLTVISSILRPHQGVIAADTGHISVHEAGAIEATGHKVLTVAHRDGKLTAESIRELIDAHYADETHEHMVQPGMVYLSNTTEMGTVYSHRELREISDVCREKGLPLYLDGARLGFAFACEESGLDLAAVAACCDVFTIGLTKQGALFGEAVVVVNPALQRDFTSLVKQRGALMAKGWLMGLQFETLMEDGLYLSLSRQAVMLAMKMRDGLKALGLDFLIDSPSNQQFPILPDAAAGKLRASVSFNVIAPLPGGLTAIRLCTSWATEEAEIDALLTAVREALA